MEDSYFGIIAERERESDWLAGDIVIPRAPKGTQSFYRNGSIQYDQREVSKVSCTIHGAMGAYSDLTGHTFSMDQRKEIWNEALRLGANPDVGWYVDSAVDLVRNWVNGNLATKVSSYRVSLSDVEFGLALRMGYSVVMGYRGNAFYGEDKSDGILDKVSFGNGTYGHCLRAHYSVGDEYDCIVDNYNGSKSNIYRVPSGNWGQLVKNRVFFDSGYIYLLK